MEKYTDEQRSMREGGDNNFDFLTGLPSLTYFFELAEECKAELYREGEHPVFLFFDLRGMKFYNSEHGFAQGDNLIKSFADLIVDSFGSRNCCHIGGDHFAAFTREDGVEDIINKLFHDWHEKLDGKELPVRVGIYLNRIEDVPAYTACDRAKFACDSIRNSYSSSFGYYNEMLKDDLEKRKYVLSNIDQAIECKWIQVYYQPIVRAVNGRVCDEEALARWNDPIRGFLSPADFIPYLEDEGQIYKLDLYVLKQVLEKIKIMKEHGLHLVPQSINLSRSDFDVCDFVDKIREVVDDAGVSHDLITIEITESIVGSDFEFIKQQIERFRELGFAVWLDDFGSGFSSLNVLQSVKFDLIKFDMSFMKRLNEGNDGKIILTELMKMATALGVDTVCEGVETEEQVRFLQTIGCSKLQGYYYLKPVPLERILERYRTGTQIGFEDPREEAYFDGMGRINLYDLSFLASKDENILQNTFDTLPMGVIEVSQDGDFIQYVRCNESFRDFINRTFEYDMSTETVEYAVPQKGPGSVFMKKVGQCRTNGDRVFIEEKHADGTIVHSFARRIGVNPVTGKVAVAVAILSVTEPDTGTTYAGIARALAADYYNLFYVDLTNGNYIEYSSPPGGEEIAVERHGEDFFNSAREDSLSRVYEKDQEIFLRRFTKENIIRELDEQGSFLLTYRLIDTGEPVYARMKIMRMEPDQEHIIVGVSIIDAQMKQQEEEDRLRQEKLSLGRVAALSPNFIVLYTVDPVTGNYTQFNPSSEFASFGLARQGEDFFNDVRIDAAKAIDPKDMERHLRVLTKENMLGEIKKNGFFVHNYGLLMDGKSVPVSLRATLTYEEDGEKILLGVLPDDKAELRIRLEEAGKIKVLNQTITSLLDNMPGMTFTKDAGTGSYLACNQAFAEYAHKASPEGLLGLTDADIFDPVTAAHFVEDDKKALSMDKSYIFFEDVLDAAGNQRQFQTTKMKYTDISGRVCLLGMCQDVTDLVKIQRQYASAKEAYGKVRSSSIIYGHIAQALARGYTDLFYVNMETDELIEYHTDDELGVLNEARRGDDFFDGCKRDAKLFVHPDDQAAFVEAMNREFLAKTLDRSKVFEMTYRRIKDGRSFYVRMRVSRVEEDRRYIVIAVQDVDELIKKRHAEERMMEERIIYARLQALTGNFIVVYVVDPMTNEYREFSATDDYTDSLRQAKEGTDFFEKVREGARQFNYPGDLDRFLTVFSKENVMAEVEHNGTFTFGYRLMMEGRPVHVQMKAVMVEEKEGPRLVVGLNNIDLQVRQEEEIEKRLEQAQTQAHIDALTGVKNRHAYLMSEERIDRQIEDNHQRPFAVVIFDVNDLKKVNDTAGHQAGDQYLRDACRIICEIFKHSPVFRVGGDEFAVIVQDKEYLQIDDRIKKVREHNAAALQSGEIVIACGMAKYENDDCVAAVFERADHNMYENKSELKSS